MDKIDLTKWESIPLEFKAEELILVLTALEKMPYNEVVNLINSIFMRVSEFKNKLDSQN